MPYVEAMFRGTIVMLAYTFFGGFLAVSWSDVLQGSLMFIALVIVALAGIVAGGLTVILWKRGADAGGVFALYELVPGFVFSSLAIWLVSLATQPALKESATHDAA